MLVEAAAIVARSMPGRVHPTSATARTCASRSGGADRRAWRRRAVHPGRAPRMNPSTGFLAPWDLGALPPSRRACPPWCSNRTRRGSRWWRLLWRGRRRWLLTELDGFLVPPGDPEALAGRVSMFYGWRKSVSPWGRRGRAANPARSRLRRRIRPFSEALQRTPTPRAEL